jgi:hypothetical protein
MKKVCSIDGCGKLHRSKGLCNAHYLSAWTNANIDKKKLSNAKYRLKNKEKHSEYNKEWFSKNKAKASFYAMRRYTTIRHRTPKWITEDDLWMISQAYELAELRSKMFGFKWSVDHIIPLHGKNVSGFHVPNNLQVITALENSRKSNNFLTEQTFQEGVQ